MTETIPAEPATRAGRLVRLSRTRRIILLAVVLGLVGAAIGAVVGARLAGVHTATASVLVSPLDGNPYSGSGNGSSLVNLETEAQLVGSAEVVAAVQQKVDGVDAATLQSGLNVAVPSNTQILTIAYSSRQADLAVQVSQAFADDYLAYRSSRAAALTKGQVDQLQEQISTLQKQQSQYGDRLDKIDQGSGEAAVLRAQLESTTSQIDQLRANLADLQASSDDPGNVITPASLPAPSPVPLWAVGALAGLLSGVVLGVLLGSLAFRRPAVRALSPQDASPAP